MESEACILSSTAHGSPEFSLGTGLADSVAVGVMGVMEGLDSLSDEQAESTKGMVKATAIIRCVRTYTFKHEAKPVDHRPRSCRTCLGAGEPN